MTDVILHIGPHKTGTSAIQSYLDRHHDRLLAAGVDFPMLGRAENGFPSHRHFAALFRMAGNELPPLGFAARVAEGVSTAPLAILSSEDFYYCSTRIAMKRVHKRIGVPKQVIAYLRQPTGHLLSLWREGLKQTVTTSLRGFSKAQMRALSNPNRFAYFRMQANFAVWDRLCPVTVIPFGGDDLVGGFFQACGLSDLYLQDESETENVGAEDSVVICQLMANRALAGDKLSRNDYKWLKQRLRDPRAAEALRPIEPHIERREEDLSTFLARCRAHNPAFAEAWEGSAESLTVPVGIDGVILKDVTALLQNLEPAPAVWPTESVS
ncbi:hypothetical protein ATO6_22655 [Oceanicola sp. 22II-s10i]|uniref:hypothetical protein n=1 Tax=Oceanicola sp. 22II-s10i TaxID=1317116 RepID=UPI000B522421|nr:hypothetical protein [Oceanicola sp. 22II-s10i]OWU82249.1 hypothetical protein ATO6_22655 [Oceanicola sp. 22II-s10i]